MSDQIDDFIYPPDPDLAARLLGWKAERGVDEMCADHWKWQSENPRGFRS